MAKRIDDSHQPFKRTGAIGPGPKKRPKVHQEKNWECQKGKATAKHYVQICTYVGDYSKRRGKKIKVLRSKASKKKYNKLWRAWAKRNKRISALQSRGAKRGYSCRKTPIAKCK
jgi:hypothetical protein